MSDLSEFLRWKIIKKIDARNMKPNNKAVKYARILLILYIFIIGSGLYIYLPMSIISLISAIVFLVEIIFVSPVIREYFKDENLI